MKRILIFSLAYYPTYVAGAEVAIKEITDRIDPSEIEFDMVTISSAKEARIGNINIYKVFETLGPLQKFLYPIFAFVKAYNLHKKNKYDAVWSMMASYAGGAGFLFKLTHKYTEFILTIQEGENFTTRSILRPFFKPIFKKADLIQVISNFLYDWSRSMGATCPIVLVPNGVDIKLFSTRRSYAELEILKRDIGKKMEDTMLVTTGRLAPKNANIDIIKSLQYMPENIKLMILGDGYEEKILKELVINMKLKNRVRFLGFVGHRDMPSYLHVSDIFIRPSLSEGFGISYIEAMSAGIPVIATPVGGILDFIRDGETGLYCEVRNPKSIAQKVLKLVADRESRDYIIKNAMKMVNERYRWETIANDMKDKVFLRVI